MPGLVIAEQVRIRSSPDEVWAALTTADLTARYWAGMRIESNWSRGGIVRYRRGGVVTDRHTILYIDPPWCLVHTFQPLLVAFKDEAPSRLCLQLLRDGDHVQLRLRHDSFAPDSQVYGACRDGWSLILGRLKAMLESEVGPEERVISSRPGAEPVPDGSTK